jgi:hypothetical protein
MEQGDFSAAFLKSSMTREARGLQRNARILIEASKERRVDSDARHPGISEQVPLS